MLGDTDVGDKRPLLPSELKKLLKSKRTKHAKIAKIPQPEIREGNGCFTLAASETTTCERSPLRQISTNETVKPRSQPALTVERPKISWTLAKKLTIKANESVVPLKTCFGHKANTGCHLEKVLSIARQFDFYRFPYPNLPDPRRLCNIIAKTSGSLEREFFKSLVDTWRRALLSLYNNLKSGELAYFYYIQTDLVILFRSHGAEMKALIARATKSLANLFTAEGIEFEVIGDLNDEDENNPGASLNLDVELNPVVDLNADIDLDVDSKDDPVQDQENGSDQYFLDPQSIKKAINQRLNKARKTQSKRRSSAASTLIVRGELSVHGLIDYLLNQRDGKSYVIIPELVAPGPFLHGTLSRTDVCVEGPLYGGNYQVSSNGIVLPTAAKALSDHIYELCDRKTPFEFNVVLDERSEPFLPFHL